MPSDDPVSRNLREVDGNKTGSFDVRGAKGTARRFCGGWGVGEWWGLDGEGQAAQGKIVVPDQGREQGPKTNGTVVGRVGTK